MTYRELHEALGVALRRHPDAGDTTAFIAAKKRGEGSTETDLYDTDCEAVAVMVDDAGIIIVTEGDQ